MKRPHELPSKGRMLAQIAVLLAGFALLELLGLFVIPEWSSATKSLLTRAGVVFAYLSALTGGLFFYWDAKAGENVEVAARTIACAESTNALLVQLQAEVPREVEAQVARNKAEIAAARLSLERASTYIGTKPWLGKLAIAGVVVGSYLQFLGAT